MYPSFIFGGGVDNVTRNNQSEAEYCCRGEKLEIEKRSRIEEKL